MQKFKIGDEVMGFVTIRTKRRELRTGIVESYANGRYKLSGNIEATERELVPLDRTKMRHVLDIRNRYHDAAQLTHRLYEGAMASMYQPVKHLVATQDVPNMPFRAGKVYRVAWWALEGLYLATGNGDELLVAHVAPGDDLRSDPFFRRYFEFYEPDCAE